MADIKYHLKNLFSTSGIFPEERVSIQKSLCGAAVVMALTAVFWLAEYLLSDGLISRDGYSYLMFVRKTAAVGWHSAAGAMPDVAKAPPLLVMLMYAMDSIGIEAAVAGRLLNLAGVLVFAAGIFFCTLRICRNFQLALAGALMTMAIPKIYDVSCNIMRDPLYWAMMIWIFYLVIVMAEDQQENKSCRCRDLFLKVMILAALSGLSVITRKEGISLCLVTGIWLGGFMLLQPQLQWRKRLVLIAIYAIVTVAICTVPYLFGTGWYPGKTIINDLTLSGVL